jgi:hypothetical protein
MPGCGGCSADPNEAAEDEASEEAEKELADQKAKPKPPFEPTRLFVQPNFPAEDRVLSVKPGHWSMLTAQMKANHFHYNGELHVATADRNGRPITLESTPYTFATVRDANLAKGQQKFLEFATFVPREVEGLPRLTSELRTTGGALTEAYSDPLQRMPPYQYYLVILSEKPESFRALSRNDTRLDTIRAPGDNGNLNHYKVVAPRVQKRVPLPTNGLAWTSIAYIVWDEIDPALFDVDQRRALLDWIHWGGQLIISGPGTLDKLKGSFLDPSPETTYLPATPGESVKLTPAQVHDLGEPWTTVGKDGTEGRHLVAARDWSVVKFNKHPAARFVELTDQQVVERQVGRGRIAVTSFRIGQTSLLNWPSFDCFLNAVLLRRLPREFVEVDGKLDGVAMHWYNPTGEKPYYTMDPRQTTTLRYLSRDIGDKGEFAVDGRVDDVVPAMVMTPGGPTPLNLSDPEALDSGDGPPAGKGSGVGGWNDFVGVPNAARTALRDAAGIKIPDATFVAFVLSIYLAVLVPLNWGVFRVVGRIELAWIAAPLIAVAGALSVIKLAQLDIGFARSQTEISVLEAHADYPRAHLTRYTALYASLATEYDLVFDDKNTLALPLATDANFQLIRGESIDRVEYHRNELGARLAGFTVNSNSTAMVHSEQMYDLGGVLDYSEKNGRHEVYNRTKYPIDHAGVIRRTADDRLEVAWLGDLDAGRGVNAVFTAAPDKRPLLKQWNLSQGDDADRMLQPLLHLAQTAGDLEVGEVKLIGIIRQPLGGMHVEPEPSQNEHSPTLLVAHLKQTKLANHPPLPDKNSRAAVVNEILEDLEGEMD